LILDELRDYHPNNFEEATIINWLVFDAKLPQFVDAARFLLLNGGDIWRTSVSAVAEAMMKAAAASAMVLAAPSTAVASPVTEADRAALIEALERLLRRHLAPVWLLREIYLGEFEDVFVRQRIYEEDLPFLTELDLERMGIPVGPRKRIARKLEALRNGK
jgi:hypothetical protein